MSETVKTIAFLAIGFLAIAIGFATQPKSAELDVDSLVNQDLTKNFTSVDKAKRLRIVRFDEDTATLREFEVAEEDGLWSIPSKDDYPADASRQMAEAATSLMDRKILRVESLDAGDHEQFGVIDPLSPKLEVGQKGVGTRVTVSDENENNKALVDLIIGKPVKGSESQHYVREAGRDAVYVIEIDPTKLSTNFEDWIEKDLLKLNPWDLQQVQIKDYSAELVPAMTAQGISFNVAWDPRAEMTLDYDETKGAWTPEKLSKFDPASESQVPFTLNENEELNTASLNALKDSLDDLAIVDVVRKPQGLSDDLKAGGDFLGNREAQLDLMKKGFVAAASSGAENDEIISSDGEVIATLKDGTEYVLRFGNLTNVAAPGEPAPSETAEAGDGSDDATKSDGESDVHRYLFVMARFNEEAIKKPQLEELPALPAETPAADAAPASSDTAPEADATKTQDAASSETPPPAPSDDATTAAADADAKTEAADGAPEDAAKPEADASEGDGAPEGEEPTQADQPTAAGTDTPTSDEAKASDVEKIIAERKRIETENQRKLDEYQAQITKGQNNVKDLNARFGDWYFVVANDVFNKIRLGKDDVIKTKEQPAAAESAEDSGTSAVGAPGTAIPGLPTIPGASE